MKEAIVTEQRSESTLEVSGKKGQVVGAIVIVAFIVAFAARFGWDLAGRLLGWVG